MSGRIFRSVFRVGWPRTRQERLAAMLSSLVLHVHPARVRVHVLRPAYTLGLGLASFFLFVALTLSGLALMLYYVPHPDAAYRSMKDLQFAVTFGMLVRNAHRWAAHGMVAIVFLHMCRVFFTGAHKPPREFNWVVGVLLLLLTLALSFTGYLLPWDQLAFWAITVGTSMVAYFPGLGPALRYLLLGGHELGQAALLRFYVLHCLVLPLAMAALVALHFWRVRKDGGLSVPPQHPARRVPVCRPRKYQGARAGPRRMRRWLQRGGGSSSGAAATPATRSRASRRSRASDRRSPAPATARSRRPRCGRAALRRRCPTGSSSSCATRPRCWRRRGCRASASASLKPPPSAWPC